MIFNQIKLLDFFGYLKKYKKIIITMITLLMSLMIRIINN